MQKKNEKMNDILFNEEQRRINQTKYCHDTNHTKRKKITYNGYEQSLFEIKMMITTLCQCH